MTAAVRKAKFDLVYAISIFTLTFLTIILTAATATQVTLSVLWNARTRCSITSRFSLQYWTALSHTQQSVKTDSGGTRVSRRFHSKVAILDGALKNTSVMAEIKLSLWQTHSLFAEFIYSGHDLISKCVSDENKTPWLAVVQQTLTMLLLFSQQGSLSHLLHYNIEMFNIFLMKYAIYLFFALIIMLIRSD